MTFGTHELVFSNSVFDKKYTGCTFKAVLLGLALMASIHGLLYMYLQSQIWEMRDMISENHEYCDNVKHVKGNGYDENEGNDDTGNITMWQRLPGQLLYRFKRDDRRSRQNENGLYHDPRKQKSPRSDRRRNKRKKNSNKRNGRSRKRNSGTVAVLRRQKPDTQDKVLHVVIDTIRHKVLKTGPQDSVINLWKLQDDSYNKLQTFAVFHMSNSTVTVVTPGFYFIYSQVTYFDKTGRWSHAINISDRTFTKCLMAEWGMKTNPDTGAYYNTVHQCYTAGGTFIDKDEHVSIRSMYANRTIHADPLMSFWGLIKL